MDSLSLTELNVGSHAPDFELNDLAGRPHRLSRLSGSVVVLNFWSAECPWAERGDRLLAGASPGWGPGVVVWRVASNANETPEQLQAAADGRGLEPVLLDLDQAVADLYGAATTPHLYVIDSEGVLRYRGAPDDVNWERKHPTRDYVDAAVRAALEGRSPDPATTPAFGCSLVRFKV
jgi:peroxiredoxin